MKKVIWTSIIGILLIGIALQFINGEEEMTNIQSDTKVIAHRGASAYEPENSIASIEKAIELGVDFIEIDLQRTKDSVLVVLHDKTINRTTTGKGACKNLTYDEIKAHSIINKNDSITTLTIPTFEEVLTTIDSQTNLLIEIKESSDYYPGIEQQVIDILHKHDALNWCVIQSFHDDILSKVHQIEPNIELQKLFYGNFLGFGIKRKSLEEYDYISSFNGFYLGINQSFVDKVHALNKKVFVWTINSDKNVIKSLNKGVDGIIGNDPQLIKNHLNPITNK